MGFCSPSAVYFITVSSFSSIVLIHGNLQQGDERIESIKAGVLLPVLDIHDGAWGAVHELGQVFLCPAFGFSFALDFLAKA